MKHYGHHQLISYLKVHYIGFRENYYQKWNTVVLSMVSLVFNYL